MSMVLSTPGQWFCNNVYGSKLPRSVVVTLIDCCGFLAHSVKCFEHAGLHHTGGESSPSILERRFFVNPRYRFIKLTKFLRQP